MIINYKHFFLDIKRFAGYLSGRPFINYCNILLTFLLSRLTGRVYQSYLPFAVSAEISSVCNLNCPECMLGKGEIIRERSFMDKHHFGKLLSETSRWSFYLNLYFQGEPFMNPEIFDFISKARHKKFYTVVSTNGHFLDKSHSRKLINAGLNRLIVSLDGITPETYTIYRKNGKHHKVIEGIKSLVQQRNVMRKTSPLIVLQYLIHKGNEHELSHLKDFGKDLGVDIVEIKTMQFYSNESADEMMPTDERFRRYHKCSDGAWELNKRRNICFRLWSQMVITADGNVVTCCYDKKPVCIAGNISDSSLHEIWAGYRLNSIRKSILLKKDIPAICQNCYG